MAIGPGATEGTYKTDGLRGMSPLLPLAHCLLPDLYKEDKKRLMKKEILHKNDRVASVEMDSRGFIGKIYDVYNPDLLPCVYSKDEADLKVGLQRWLLSRQLGRTRADIAPIKAFYGTDVFASKHMVSLNDSYWIKDTEEAGNEEDADWDNVSPFKNWDYEEDCYFDLLHDPENTYDVDNISPNLTIPGNDPRFWYIKDDEIGIITENSQRDMKTYKKALDLGFEEFVAKRSYMILQGTIYSFHPTGTSEKIERIPFDLLYDSVASDSEKKIDNLKNCCEKYNLPDWRKFLSAIMKLDNELGNKERNLCEIGVLRDSDSLEILGFEKI